MPELIPPRNIPRYISLCVSYLSIWYITLLIIKTRNKQIKEILSSPIIKLEDLNHQNFEHEIERNLETPLIVSGCLKADDPVYPNNVDYNYIINKIIIEQNNNYNNNNNENENENKEKQEKRQIIRNEIFKKINSYIYIIKLFPKIYMFSLIGIPFHYSVMSPGSISFSSNAYLTNDCLNGKVVDDLDEERVYLKTQTLLEISSSLDLDKLNITSYKSVNEKSNYLVNKSVNRTSNYLINKSVNRTSNYLINKSVNETSNYLINKLDVNLINNLINKTSNFSNISKRKNKTDKKFQNVKTLNKSLFSVLSRKSLFSTLDKAEFLNDNSLIRKGLKSKTSITLFGTIKKSKIDQKFYFEFKPKKFFSFFSSENFVSLQGPNYLRDIAFRLYYFDLLLEKSFRKTFLFVLFIIFLDLFNAFIYFLNENRKYIYIQKCFENIKNLKQIFCFIEFKSLKKLKFFLRKIFEFPLKIFLYILSFNSNEKKEKKKEEKFEERFLPFDSDSRKKVCIICYKNSSNVLAFPCKHLISCLECLSDWAKNCPICRVRVRSTSLIKRV